MTSSVSIDDDLEERVTQLAAVRARSPDWIMREAIRQYVERAEARESFKQDARVSFAALLETGRHLSGDDVKFWLDTWGLEDEADLPECRS